jgi:hypothetical protein
MILLVVVMRVKLGEEQDEQEEEDEDLYKCSEQFG